MQAQQGQRSPSAIVWLVRLPPPLPSASSSNVSKNAKIVDAFAPKKLPTLDNVLQFPPPLPSSSYPSSVAVARKAPPPSPKASRPAGRLSNR